MWRPVFIVAGGKTTAKRILHKVTIKHMASCVDRLLTVKGSSGIFQFWIRDGFRQSRSVNQFCCARSWSLDKVKGQYFYFPKFQKEIIIYLLKIVVT